MKVSIRRHGIVIRMVDVTGNKAKIGSGEQCEIRVDDPYLSAHVADLVEQKGSWRLVDTGTSLEGLTRAGSRVEDEAVMPGQSYSVGGFELIFEGAPAGVAPRTVGGEAVIAPRPAPYDVPETVVESFENMRGGVAPQPPSRPQANAPIPKTMFESPMPPPSSAPPPAFVPQQPQPMMNPALQGFQPMAGPTVAAPPARPKSSSKRILLLAAGLGMLFLILILAVLMSLREKKEPPVPVVTTSSPAAAPTPVSTTQVVADPVAQGEAFARSLEIDKALESWEKALAKPNPELQRRYALTALEVGMVHAAANDVTGAKKYFEKVVKHGPADSPEVALAKSKLAS